MNISKKRFSVILIIIIGLLNSYFFTPHFALASTIPTVPGENYQLCPTYDSSTNTDQYNATSTKYLTSPWTYDAVASGSATTYTVSQYEGLSGYGTTLPPLPSYIASESAGTTAAVIFGPGSTVSTHPYYYPESPILYFFEGGYYGDKNPIAFQSISGDEFIGGSAPGYPEPQFNDGSKSTGAGISDSNDTYGFSGAALTVTATASAGTTIITTNTALPKYSAYMSFSDGTTYKISSTTGDSTTLNTPLSNTIQAGDETWVNSTAPIATVSTSATQSASTVTFTTSTIPLVQYGEVEIGNDAYLITSITGNQSGYTINVGSLGLDKAVAANTPVYYALPSGNVTVEYLDISHDYHTTTGTITMGSGWTFMHNYLHNSYGYDQGVALYGGDRATVEYNCFSRYGIYALGGSGQNEVIDYNEVRETPMEPDPNCGCSGGGKWWGTLNDEVNDNAFVDNGLGGDQGVIWLDNGNTGMIVEGNYFYHNASNAIENETGFNMLIKDNLFLDEGWGDGTGQGENNDGSININSSGGMNIPLSNYENEILITGNYFINDWMGIDIWQATGRSCLQSGEGFPVDTAYCSGGFPTTDSAAADGQYYFSHQGDSGHLGTTTVGQKAASGSATVYTIGPEAIDDQIGFADPASTTTTDTTDVTTFDGTATASISATTTGFPTSGDLRVDTSASGGGGGYTGAILSYNGVTGSRFNNVSLIRGSGTLSGTILQVQPYKVTSETCYTNQCALSISPSLTATESAGTTVTNAGTCPLFATSVALPSGPLAPNGVSYFDGCTWVSKNITITGNTFEFQPSLIANTAPPIGSASGTECDVNHTGNCGTNFMAFQTAGGAAPYNDNTGMNALMSNSTFTSCPYWDTGCSSDPLSNINALANPPGASTNNGEGPDNNIWTNNTYQGPWDWSDIYSNSGCLPVPQDGSNAMPTSPSPCINIGLSSFQSNWQQGSGSTYNPIMVTVATPSASMDIYGTSRDVLAYEDTGTTGGITTHLFLNNTTDTTIATSSSTPVNFYLNTTNYPDGTYTLKVNGIDTGDNAATDSASVYITNGDFNGDNKVNLSDLAIMAAHWGQKDSSYSDGNITGGTTIGNSDLTVLASNWGWVK